MRWLVGRFGGRASFGVAGWAAGAGEWRVEVDFEMTCLTLERRVMMAVARYSSMMHALEQRRMLSVSLEDHVLVVRGEVCFDDEIIVSLTGALDASFGTVEFNGELFWMRTPDLPEKVVIYGGDGDDRITVLTGLMWPETIVRGGKGRDEIRVSGPHSDVKGGGGDDVIESDIWLQDRPRGTRGSTLHGGSGSDVIRASNGDDFIEGGPGTDVLSGGRDSDTIRGGSGDDVIHGGYGTGEGKELLEGSVDEDVLYGGAGNDTLRGEGGELVSEGGLLGAPWR